MHIKRAYKTELRPNNKQRNFFRKYAGTTRFVYNWALADRQARYEDGLKASHYEQRRRFNALKREECPWIVEIPYAVTETAFANLDNAFKHFFRRIKNGETPGYPKFKKRGHKESFALKYTRIEHDRVRLTHVDWVRLKERDYIPTTNSGAKFCTYATVSERAGRWYISVLVEEDMPEREHTGESLGIDLGIKRMAVCSDGSIFENPKALYVAHCKMKKLQKELSRRTRGGSNWKKTKAKIAKCHTRIANIRKHAQHQISHYATVEANPTTVVLENLNVSGMVKNHHLARAISDVGMYELRRQIEYKAAWQGTEVVIADRWFPSSKTCSECGSVKPLLSLSERTYLCEECGLVIDRDLNAAKNLASYKCEPRNTRELPGELVPLGATVNQEAGALSG